jgi:site-specific recombinase XerD
VVEIRWERFPLLKQHPRASTWLRIQARLGLAANTIEAYGRALEAFLRFSAESAVEIDTTTREQLSLYVRSLMERTFPVKSSDDTTISNVGLSNSTMQQRLTALRLYFDYLMEEGLRTDNPVGRGRYTPGKAFGNQTQRGLLPRFHKLP